MCNGEVLRPFQLKPMTARHISCTSQRNHDEANEIVKHSKRPMGIPFLTPMNDRIFNWASPVGVAQQLLNSQPRIMHLEYSDWFTQSWLSAHIP